MKNRIELAKYFAKLGFKSGAEIGVWDGRYSEILCQSIPELRLLAVDSWQASPNYRESKEEWRLVYDTARSKLKSYGVSIIKKTSMSAAQNVLDESLDFVFIDADHRYEAVKKDIGEWSKKVKPSGIVAGHDYYVTRSGNDGVIKAVDEYTKRHGYSLNLTDWDHENSVEDDRQPCWYFFKRGMV